MIALLDAYRLGLLNKKHWWPNILSGLLVGIVALPLAMAFAIASGTTPQQGLYTAIVAAIVTGLFGGTRAQISGPTGAFVVILSGIVAKYGISGLQMASLMAGVMLLIMGLLKLGNVIKFIPDPVVIGFTTGIGVIIFVGEWKDFLGLTVQFPLDASFIQKLSALITALPTTHLATLGLSILSLLLIIFSPKLIKKLPGPLVAMVVVTVLQRLFHFSGVTTIGSVFGEIPSHLPNFGFPAISLNQFFNLIGPAFTIALLGSIESLLSATAADSMAGTRHNSNQELIGQGLANLITPLLGGFAATGAIARTATNIRNGGTSPLAALVHSAILILVILFLAPIASDIPLCVLAAILFVVAYNMSDLKHFFHTLRLAPRYDAAVLLITCLLTIFTNLVIAVYIGMMLSMLFFLRRMYQHTSIYSHQEHSSPCESVEDKAALASLTPDTLVYYLEGPFFFGTARKIEQALTTAQVKPKKVILRLKEVPYIDATGLFTLKEILLHYQSKKIDVYLCEANTRVIRKLRKTKIINLVSKHHVYSSLEKLVKQWEK